MAFAQVHPVEPTEEISLSFEDMKEIAHNRLLKLAGLAAGGPNVLKIWNELIMRITGAQYADPSLQFATVKSGDLALLTLNLKKIKALGGEDALRTTVYFRDAEGLGLVDVAYLSGHSHIGRYLISRFPKLAAQPCACDLSGTIEYAMSTFLRRRVMSLAKIMGFNDPKDLQHVPEFRDSMLYTGQNVLHIAIMRQDFEETRWILDFYLDHFHAQRILLDQLLRAEATGAFFNRPDFYMGRTPLQFAVCSNNTRMFDVVHNCIVTVTAMTADIDDIANEDNQYELNGYTPIPGIYSTDDRGNNLLHLCVLLSLPAMCHHIMTAAAAATRNELHNAYVQHHSADQPASSPRFALDIPFTAGFPLRSPIHRVPEQSMIKASLDRESKLVVDAQLLHALNLDLHSPVTLAAAIINKEADDAATMALKVEMLRSMIGYLKETAWKYGPVSLPIVHLDGIEIKYNVARDFVVRGRERELLEKPVHGAICWLCINDSDQAMLIPEIQKIVQTKWNCIGYPRFMLSCALHTLLTALVTLILIFINITPASNSGYHVVVFMNIVYAVVAFSYFVMFLQEVRDFLVFGWGYANIRGVARFEKVLRVIKIFAFVSFCCCKAVAANHGRVDQHYSQHGPVVYYNVPDDQGIKVSMVVCVIASYLHMYYYFMGFESTGPFVLTMFRIISKDVPYFMNFYMIVVAAFACALSVLANDHNNDPGYGFFHLLKAVWTLIQSTVGTPATHDNIGVVLLYPQHLQWLADILLTFYNISVIIVMLNLLIAMISSTYEDYTNYNDAFLLMAKYDIMNAMEWAMGERELQRLRDQYAQIQEEEVQGDRRYDTAEQRHILYDMVRAKHVFELASDLDRQWFNGKDAARGKIEGIEQTPYGKTALLIINPQRDYHPGGTLAVPGADQDSARIAQMLRDFGRAHINDIFVTLNSPQSCHIAYPASWQRGSGAGYESQGSPPSLFCIITHQHVVDKVWAYKHPAKSEQEWAERYVRELQRQGQKLTIWPEHCVLGSKGHSVMPVINDALQRWASPLKPQISYTMTGQNSRVEMYSALRAMVEDPLDTRTGLNQELVAKLKLFDRVLVCGTALSHAVNYTMRDLIDLWGSDASKLVLLSDASSPVIGFDTEADILKQHCVTNGVKILTCVQAFEGCTKDYF